MVGLGGLGKTGFAVVGFHHRAGRSDFPHRHAEVVDNLAFSPDGLLLAAGTRHTAMLWDLQRRQVVDELVCFTGRCTALSFNGLGTYFAANFKLGPVCLWDLHDRRLIYRGRPDDRDITSLALSPDPETRFLALARGPDVILEQRQVRPEHARQTWTVGEKGRPLSALAFSANGRHLAVSLEEGPVQVRDMETGELLHTISRHEPAVASLAFFPTAKSWPTPRRMDTFASGTSPRKNWSSICPCTEAANRHPA